MIIYWLYTLNGFRIIFLWRDSATQEWNLENKATQFLVLQELTNIRLRALVKCLFGAYIVY